MKFGIRKLFIVSILVGLATLGAKAQNPVSLSMTVKPAKAKAGDKLTAQISASIGGGWHMYSLTQGAGGPTPTRITVEGGAIKTSGGARGPAPKREMDPNFGIVTETYSGGANFTVPLVVDASAQPGTETVNATVRYQVCNETTCLPPKSVKLSATVEIAASNEVRATPSPAPTPSVSPTPTATVSPTPTPKNANANANIKANANVAANSNANGNENLNGNANLGETNQVVGSVTENPPNNSASVTAAPAATPATLNAENMKDKGLWSFIGLAMMFGALSLLTPCVFPMIPITVSYFTKNAAETKAGSVRDALIYALGIILTFTALGVALALFFGAAGLNQFASNPWINLLITAIFLAFAFSLLGAFNIGVPSGMLTKIDSFTRSKESSKTIGLLLMGLTFSLTSFTCTAPLVGTILVAAANGELLYPIAGMLAFSSVFALPFFILALAPQLLKSLPSSGGWMNSLKVVMGFLEIGAALKFLSNADLVWGWGIFTRELVLAGWVALAVLVSLYLLGVFKLSHDFGENKIGLIRVLNAFLFISLAFYLLTGLFGRKLGELEPFLPPATEEVSNISSGTKSNAESEWITNDYQAALKKAKAENKPVFIDFTGYTCTNCRWMEANMFPKKSIKEEMDKFVRVRLYTDGEGEPYEGFQKMQEEKYGTVALPLYAIISPSEEILAKFAGLTRDESEFAGFLKSGSK